MPTILIVEATPAALIAQGRFDFAACFRPVLQTLDPGLSLHRTNPYDLPWCNDLVAKADGVIFAGSSVDWSVDAPQAAPARAAMEAVFAAGKPVWGSCNGLQLAAVVLGGAVGSSVNGTEVGLARDIRMTAAGQRHPMLAGLRDGYAAPCIHRDEVTCLPEAAVLLAGNAHSPVQAMVYEHHGVDFWGTQYHPEICAAQMARCLSSSGTEPDLMTALASCETDKTVAQSHGIEPAGQPVLEPAAELANWLGHLSGHGVVAL